MAKRIPVETVVVVRDGKRVRPTIGQPFDFTADEILQIVGSADKPGLRPQALKKVSGEDEDLSGLEEAREGPPAAGDAGVPEPPVPEAAAGDVGKPAKGAQRGKQARPADDDEL